MSSSSSRDKPSFDVAAPSLGSCAFNMPCNVASSSTEMPRGLNAMFPGHRNIPTVACAEPASASVATRTTDVRNAKPRGSSPPSARGFSKRARSPTIAEAGFDACTITRVSSSERAQTRRPRKVPSFTGDWVFKTVCNFFGRRENRGSVLESRRANIAGGVFGCYQSGRAREKNADSFTAYVLTATRPPRPPSPPLGFGRRFGRLGGLLPEPILHV